MTDVTQRITDLLAAATPGPWHWSGNVDMQRMELSTWSQGWGRCTVMGAARWGMRGARFRFAEDMVMVDADKLAVFEVARDATDRSDPRVYRGDVVGIRHPDAALIAAAPTLLAECVSRITELEAEVANVRGQELRRITGQLRSRWISAVQQWDAGVQSDEVDAEQSARMFVAAEQSREDMQVVVDLLEAGESS